MRAYDAVFMEQAVALAEHGRGRTSPNPLVGALIVDEATGGEPVVLSSGYHARPGRDHAEVAALRRIGGRAPGKTLYVTLEPCNHIGRTGKCTEAILAAGLGRVVVGMHDPNPRVSGGGIERLRRAGIEVTVGVLEDRCRHQNRGYLRWLASGRPHMMMKAALSLDGRLALMDTKEKAERAPAWLTSGAARKEAHRLRDGCDAILVGAGTVLSDDPLLTVRLPGAERRDDRQPLRVVLDGALRTPPTARLCGPKTLILTSAQALAERPEQAAMLQGRGVELLALPAGHAVMHYKLDLVRVLQALGERELLFVMCEGGAMLHGALLEARLYDEAALFFAPLFLGNRGLPLCRDLQVDALSTAPWLDSMEHARLGPDFFIRGLLRPSGFGAKAETEDAHVHRAG